MLALAAFLTARPKLIVGPMMAAIVFGFLVSIYLHGDRDGAQRVRDDNARQDQRAQSEALGFWQQVEQCIGAGGQWDQTTGKCDMGDAL